MSGTGRIAGLLCGVVVLGVGAAKAMEWRSAGNGVAYETARAAAPLLIGRTSEGGEFVSSALRGAPAVLLIMPATQCGLCTRRLDALAAHAHAYEQLGARIVVVAPEVDAVAATAGVQFVAASRTALAAWHVWPGDAPAPRPAEFVIDEHGGVIYEHRGRNSADTAGDVELLAVLRAHAAVQPAR